MTIKPFLSAAACAEIARRLKQSFTEAELDEITREVKPFIGAADTDEMRTLKERCLTAMRQADNRREVCDDYSATVTARLHTLRAMRQFKGSPWGQIIREVLIEHEAAWLGSLLVDASEQQGRLTEIDRLLARRRGGDPFANRGQYRVISAYVSVLDREKRPPFITELLRQLGINKPRRTSGNMREWLKVNGRERVIRKTLKRCNLPLSPGKRGRPR